MSNTDKLDRLLQSFVDGGLPGCGLIVTQKGKTIYEGYRGFGDIKNGTPVGRDSLFRQASMSKLPLYTSAMMLYEQGKFNLTDPVGNYLPEWKDCRKYIIDPNGAMKAVPTEKPMTVSDILSMKCGLPYCNGMEPTTNPTLSSMQACLKPLKEKGYYTTQEHAAAMSKAILAYEPGTHWTYGFSSEITAAFLEVITGKDIDTVFREMLFEPLGMDHTRSRFAGNDEQKLVKLYGKDKNGENEELHLFFDDKHKPGPENEQGWPRLFSTVEDYAKLMTMLACGGVYEGKKIIGRKTIDLMRANGLTPEMLKDFEDPYNAGYGYGYGVRTLIDKAKANHNGSLGAFGWTGGFGTWCEADPEEQVAIVYMHNTVPNNELYYHHRVRVAAYASIE